MVISSDSDSDGTDCQIILSGVRSSKDTFLPSIGKIHLTALKLLSIFKVM